MKELVLGLILSLMRCKYHEFVSLQNALNSLLWCNSCHLMIVFDLPYMKSSQNNYVIIIRLFAGYGASLIFLG